MRKTTVLALLAGVSLAGVSLATASRPVLADEAPATPEPPVVSVARAAAGRIVETATVTGTLTPREEILVSPQLDGVAITEILVEEGDTVRSGQVLARLSREQLDAALAQNAAQIARYVAAVAQAQSSVAEAAASTEEAAAAFGRTRDLVRSGAASRESFDSRQASARTTTARQASAQAALLAAQADLDYAKAQHQELAVRLAHTDITAPMGGVVSRRTARLGSVVSMSADPLFRIISNGAIELEADVPESTLARLRPGQPAALHMAGEVDRQGTIRLVSPEVNRTSRLGRIRVAIAPGDGGLVLGGFGRAVVQIAAHEGVLVPLSAVQFEADGAQVEVVRDGVIESRPVRLGLRADGKAEIVQGVAQGEAVVAVSGTFIRNGDHVTARDTAARGS